MKHGDLLIPNYDSTNFISHEVFKDDIKSVTKDSTCEEISQDEISVNDQLIESKAPF
jgi:hypothetical protein